jgi:hypothetical protein
MRSCGLPRSQGERGGNGSVKFTDEQPASYQQKGMQGPTFSFFLNPKTTAELHRLLKKNQLLQRPVLNQPPTVLPAPFTSTEWVCFYHNGAINSKRDGEQQQGVEEGQRCSAGEEQGSACRGGWLLVRGEGGAGRGAPPACLLVQVKKQAREFGVWEKKNRSRGGGC